MTTWSVGVTDSDHYAVYRDGERWFDAYAETGDAQPAKQRAEWLVALLQRDEADKAGLRGGK